MKPRDIQDVFRFRHILVLGVEVDEMAFDLPGLATMGSLTIPQPMQGELGRPINHFYLKFLDFSGGNPFT